MNSHLSYGIEHKNVGFFKILFRYFLEMASRKELWSLSWREVCKLRGLDANSYVESMMGILKDIILKG